MQHGSRTHASAWRTAAESGRNGRWNIVSASPGRYLLECSAATACKGARFTVCTARQAVGWLGSRVVSALDSGAERPGFR